MASVAADCAIRVDRTSIEIGQWKIPFRELINFRVLGSTVRVYTGAWGMGLEKGCQIDFQSDKIEQIEEFVRGLLQNTPASFGEIDSIEPTYIDSDDPIFWNGRWKVEIVSNVEGWIFNRFIAPVFFEGWERFSEGNKVILFSRFGKKEEIREELQKAFKCLNWHANNTVFRALATCPELIIPERFWDPGRFQGEKDYRVTVDSAEKGEKRQWVPLEFSEGEAESMRKRLPLVQEIMEFRERHGQAERELKDFAYQIYLITDGADPITECEGPQDAVQLEVWKNLLNCKWLADKVQNIKEKIWEDLISLDRTMFTLEALFSN